MAVFKNDKKSTTRSNNIAQAAQKTQNTANKSSTKTARTGTATQKAAEAFKQAQTRQRTAEATKRMNTQYASSTPYNQQNQTQATTKKVVNNAGTNWERQMRQAESQSRPTQIKSSIDTGKIFQDSLRNAWNALNSNGRQGTGNSAFDQMSRQNASVRYDQNPVNGASPTPSRASQLYDIQMRLADQYARPTNYSGANQYNTARQLARVGQAQNELVESSPAAKAIADTNRMVISGMENSINGIANIPGELMRTAGTFSGYTPMTRAGEDWMKALDDADVQEALRANNSVAGNMVGNVAQGVGGMIPSILLNPLGEGTALATMLTGAYGSSTKEGMNNLASDGDLSLSDVIRAQAYGAGNAALEGISEMINPGMPINLPFSVSNMVGEGMEEMFSEAFDPMLQPLVDAEFGKTGDTNKEYSDYLMENTLLGVFGMFNGDPRGIEGVKKHGREIINSGISGALTSVVLSAPATIDVAQKQRSIKATTNYYNILNSAIQYSSSQYGDAIAKFGADSQQAQEARDTFVAAVSQKYVDLAQYSEEVINDLKESDIKEFKEFGELVETEFANVREQCVDNGIDTEKLDQVAAEARNQATQQTNETVSQETQETPEPQFETPHEETIEADPNEGLTVEQTETPTISDETGEFVRRELSENPSGEFVGTVNSEGNAEMNPVEQIVDENGNVSRVQIADEATNNSEAFADNVSKSIGDESEAGKEFARGIAKEISDLDSDISGAAEDFVNGEDLNDSKTQTRRYDGQTQADEFYNDASGNRIYSVVHDNELVGSAEEMYQRTGYDRVYDHIQNTSSTTNVMKATIDLQLASQFIQDSKTRIQNALTEKGYNMAANGVITDSSGNVLGNIYETGTDGIADIQELKQKEMKTQKKAIEMSSKAGLFLRSVQLLYNSDPVFRTNHLNEEIQKLNQELADMFKKKADNHQKVTVDELSDMENDALVTGFTNEQALRDFIKNETGKRWSEKKINEYVDTYFNENTSERQRSWLVQDAVDQRIANQIPSSFAEKTAAWRYLMMLANPVTHIRNITGNALMQFMTTQKNLIRYVVESALRGKSYQNSLDPTSQADNDLLDYARENMNQVLERDYNQIKDMKPGQKRAWLREHGYSGELLRSMMKAKGQFETVLNSTTDTRWSRRLAHELKQLGVTAMDGQLVNESGTFNGFDQLAKDTYNMSRRQYFEQSDFHVSNAEGRYSGAGVYARSAADAPMYKLAEQFELDNNLFGKEEAKYSINNAQRGSLKARVYGKRHFFNDSNLGGWIVNWAVDKNGWLMGDIEDTAWFTRPRYQASFVQELKSQGYTVEDGVLHRNGEALNAEQQDAALTAVSEKAMREAEQSTYHDASAVADWISQGRNVNKTLGFFLDATLPFTTTPINIGKRIIEYSPVGLLKSLTADIGRVRSGQISADVFMDNIAKGTTGSVAAAIGAWLASMGLITPKDDDDSTEGSYKRGLGISEYALHIGDQYYTLDQFAPTSTAVLFGSQLYDTVGKVVGGQVRNENITSEILGDTLNLLNPMMDMSMVSSLNDILGNSDDLADLGTNAITSYLGQYTPTAGARFNAIINENKKSTYSKNVFQNVLNHSINKVPFLPLILDMYDEKNGTEYGLPDSITRQGDVQKNVGVFDDSDNPWVRMAGRAIYNTVSPGNLTHDRTTEYDTEAMRLYEATGMDVLPKYTTLKDSNGKYYDMTPSEQEKYNQMYYGNYRDDMIEFMDSETFKTLSQMEDQTEADRIKADILYKLQRHELNMVNEDYFSGVNPDAYTLYKSDKAAEELAEIGMPKWQYYYINSLDYDTDAGGDNIMNSKQMRARQMLEAAGVYDNVIDAYRQGKISLSDVGLNSYVAKWTPEQYKLYMDQLENGQYNPGSGKPKTDKVKAFDEDLAGNEAALQAAKDIGLNAEQYYNLLDVKTDYGDDGKSISYSQDMKARQQAVESGAWDIIQEQIANGTLTIDQAAKMTGIGKTVLKWNDDTFDKFYSYLQDGTWTNETAKDLIKGAKTGSSGRSGSRSSGRRSSGRRSSGRSSGGRSVSSKKKSSASETPDAEEAMENFMKYMAKAMKGSSGSKIKSSISESQMMSLYNQIVNRENPYSIAKRIVERQKV